MSVDAFIGAVKVKRDEAFDAFRDKVRELGQDGTNDDADIFNGAAKYALDQLAGGILDVVNERYEDIIEGSATDSEGDEVSVSLTCTSELSTLYFEEVSN